MSRPEEQLSWEDEVVDRHALQRRATLSERAKREKASYKQFKQRGYRPKKKTAVYKGTTTPKSKRLEPREKAHVALRKRLHTFTEIHDPSLKFWGDVPGGRPVSRRQCAPWCKRAKAREAPVVTVGERQVMSAAAKYQRDLTLPTWHATAVTEWPKDRRSVVLRKALEARDRGIVEAKEAAASVQDAAPAAAPIPPRVSPAPVAIPSTRRRNLRRRAAAEAAASACAPSPAAGYPADYPTSFPACPYVPTQQSEQYWGACTDGAVVGGVWEPEETGEGWTLEQVLGHPPDLCRSGDVEENPGPRPCFEGKPSHWVLQPPNKLAKVLRGKLKKGDRAYRCAHCAMEGFVRAQNLGKQDCSPQSAIAWHPFGDSAFAELELIDPDHPSCSVDLVELGYTDDAGKMFEDSDDEPTLPSKVEADVRGMGFGISVKRKDKTGRVVNLSTPKQAQPSATKDAPVPLPSAPAAPVPSTSTAPPAVSTPAPFDPATAPQAVPGSDGALFDVVENVPTPPPTATFAAPAATPSPVVPTSTPVVVDIAAPSTTCTRRPLSPAHTPPVPPAHAIAHARLPGQASVVATVVPIASPTLPPDKPTSMPSRAGLPPLPLKSAGSSADCPVTTHVPATHHRAVDMWSDEGFVEAASLMMPAPDVLEGHTLSRDECWSVVRSLYGRIMWVFIYIAYLISAVRITQQYWVVPYCGERRLVVDRGVDETRKHFRLCCVGVTPTPALTRLVAWVGWLVVIGLLTFPVAILNYVMIHQGIIDGWQAAVCEVTLHVVEFLFERQFSFHTIVSRVLARKVDRDIYYVPHLLSGLLSEYDQKSPLAAFLANRNARIRRMGTFPLPDIEALTLLRGTQDVGAILVSEPRFFERGAVVRAGLGL